MRKDSLYDFYVGLGLEKEDIFLVFHSAKDTIFYNCFARRSFIFFHQASNLNRRKALKTLREKEEMLVTSKISFFHKVFYPFKVRYHYKLHVIPQIGENGWGAPYLSQDFITTQSRLLTTLGKRSFEKICGKRRKCW